MSMKVIHSSCLAAGVFGIGSVGCTPGPNPFYDARVLHCGWQDENGPNPDPEWVYGKKFCVKTGACTATAEVLCAYNVYGSEAEADRFTPSEMGFAQWDGECNESCPANAVAGKLAYPSCGVDEPVPYPYHGACEAEAEGTTGDPTGGPDPTSGGSGDSDTDGPNMEIWLCSEQAHENCQDRSGNGVNATDDHCWSTSATTSQCVEAATQAAAEAACECLCTITNDNFTDACNSPGVCTVSAPLDCEVPYSDAPKLLSSTSHACNGIFKLSESALDNCPNNFKLFDATASLVLADGTSSFASGIVGSIHHSVSNCSAGECDFSVDILVIPAWDLSGVYLQGTTIAGSYSIEDLGIKMLGSLEGTWHQSRGTVTFSSDPFWAEATMTSVTLDNSPLPNSPLTFGTNQVVGNFDSSTSVLSLNFTFDVPGGTASLSLATR